MNVGDNITLRCAASGHPNPSITWYKVSSTDQVVGTGLSIKVHADQDTDDVIMCSADNGVGPPANMTFNILAVCK